MNEGEFFQTVEFSKGFFQVFSILPGQALPLDVLFGDAHVKVFCRQSERFWNLTPDQTQILAESLFFANEKLRDQIELEQKVLRDACVQKRMETIQLASQYADKLKEAGVENVPSFVSPDDAMSYAVELIALMRQKLDAVKVDNASQEGV